LSRPAPPTTKSRLLAELKVRMKQRYDAMSPQEWDTRKRKDGREVIRTKLLPAEIVCRLIDDPGARDASIHPTLRYQAACMFDPETSIVELSELLKAFARDVRIRERYYNRTA
jgi:hypothetical protein